MRNIVIKISLALTSILVTLLILEGVAQIYVYHIAMKGKLFEPDPIVGWRVKSHVDMQRKNADGDIWTIITDKNGSRGDSDWDSKKRRVLILGDSFAFGESINIEDRFDASFEKQSYSVLNTGVMGYGTIQQILIARPYLAQLNQGDIVIVLTYYNDFSDISRKQHSGRAKPWCNLNSGGLQFHKPQISLNEVLRDRSYIYAKLFSFLSRLQEISDSDIIQSSKIYQMIIEDESQQLASRGVHVIVAYHGIPIIKDPDQRDQIVRTLSAICANTEIHCLNIDKHFDIYNNGSNFLADGHWNKKGHEVVGTLLSDKILSIIQH